MEYLIGAIVAIGSYIVLMKYANTLKVEEDSYAVTYSQSYIYEMIKPAMQATTNMMPDVPHQSTNYLKNVYMKIMVVKNKAYWIKDNRFIVADIVDGEVQKENAKEVDTMNMDKVELDEMLFIVEKLREGEDDSRSAG